MATGTLAPSPKFQAFDNSGDPLSSGLLYTYAAGTSTPLATYSDAGLTAANANPVVLDSAGRATVFLSAASYKFELQTSAGVPVWTQDNVSAVPLTSGNVDITGTAGVAMTAGQVAYQSDGSGGLVGGRWYLADADLTYASITPGIAMVVSDIAAGASGTLRSGGAVTGLAGLTAGSIYYVSATAGALTASAPTNRRAVGTARSTTVLDLNIGGVAHASTHMAAGGDPIRLDELLAPTDVTTLNATTSLHGLAPKATAPGAGLLSVLAIGNGATVRSDTAIFDTTNPAALGTAAPGTALIAARRDHVHTNPSKIVQIITASYATSTANDTSTYADTGLTATITPTSASNLILVTVYQSGNLKLTGDTACKLRLLRGAGEIALMGLNIGYTASAATNGVGTVSIAFLDSPATTSATTYKTQFLSTANVAQVRVQENSSVSTIVLFEVTP